MPLFEKKVTTSCMNYNGLESILFCHICIKYMTNIIKLQKVFISI